MDGANKVKIWLGVAWLATLLEGVWFVVVGVFILDKVSASLLALFALWLAVVGSLVVFRKRKFLVVFASLANLVGCFVIKGYFGGYPDHLWTLVYNHLIDIVMFFSSCLAVKSDRARLRL